MHSKERLAAAVAWGIPALLEPNPRTFSSSARTEHSSQETIERDRLEEIEPSARDIARHHPIGNAGFRVFPKSLFFDIRYPSIDSDKRTGLSSGST